MITLTHFKNVAISSDQVSSLRINGVNAQLLDAAIWNIVLRMKDKAIFTSKWFDTPMEARKAFDLTYSEING